MERKKKESTTTNINKLLIDGNVCRKDGNIFFFLFFIESKNKIYRNSPERKKEMNKNRM